MMRRTYAITGWTLALLLLAVSGRADDDGVPLKKAWKRAGSTIKEAAKETGHTIRDVARDANDATRDARKDAADEGQGFWSEAKHDLATALDDFSDALSELLDGSD